MTTLQESPRLRLLTLCALYLAQGIPWGFVAIALPPVRGQGRAGPLSDRG